MSFYCLECDLSRKIPTVIAQFGNALSLIDQFENVYFQYAISLLPVSFLSNCLSGRHVKTRNGRSSAYVKTTLL